MKSKPLFISEARVLEWINSKQVAQQSCIIRLAICLKDQDSHYWGVLQWWLESEVGYGK